MSNMWKSALPMTHQIPISCPQCHKSKQIPKPEIAPIWAVRCTLLCRSCWGDAKEGTVEYFSEPKPSTS